MGGEGPAGGVCREFGGGGLIFFVQGRNSHQGKSANLVSWLGKLPTDPCPWPDGTCLGAQFLYLER